MGTNTLGENLIVISGPSGVGKDTVVKKLLEKHPSIYKTISATTRNKRKNETNNVDYYFISKEQFYKHINNGNLVEYEIYDGEYYGTFYSEIEKCSKDNLIILVIDVRGRETVMMRYPMAKSVFIEPSSLEILQERIIMRGENTSDEIEHRLTTAKKELLEASKYDYIVVNDNSELCADQIFEFINKIDE